MTRTAAIKDPPRAVHGLVARLAADLSRPDEGAQVLVRQMEGLRAASRIILSELSGSLDGETEEVLVLRVASAINQVESQAIQLLVDHAEPKRPSATRLDLQQKAINAVMNGTEWSTAAEIGQQIHAEAVNPHASVSRWQASGRIFGVDHRGRKMYPRYIFDPTWQPLPVVKKVLEVFSGYAPFRVASWFESTNSYLRGKRPREMLGLDADAVLAAAKHHAVGAVHG